MVEQEFTAVLASAAEGDEFASPGTKTRLYSTTYTCELPTAE